MTSSDELTELRAAHAELQHKLANQHIVLHPNTILNLRVRAIVTTIADWLYANGTEGVSLELPGSLDQIVDMFADAYEQIHGVKSSAQIATDVDATFERLMIAECKEALASIAREQLSLGANQGTQLVIPGVAS